MSRLCPWPICCTVYKTRAQDLWMAPPGTTKKETLSTRLAMAHEDFVSWARAHKVEFLSRTNFVTGIV